MKPSLLMFQDLLQTSALKHAGDSLRRNLDISWSEDHDSADFAQYPAVFKSETKAAMANQIRKTYLLSELVPRAPFDRGLPDFCSGVSQQNSFWYSPPTCLCSAGGLRNALSSRDFSSDLIYVASLSWRNMSRRKEVKKIMTEAARAGPLRETDTLYSQVLVVPFEMDVLGKYFCLRFSVGCEKLLEKYATTKKAIGEVRKADKSSLTDEEMESLANEFRKVYITLDATRFKRKLKSLTLIGALHWENVKGMLPKGWKHLGNVNLYMLENFMYFSMLEWPFLARVLSEEPNRRMAAELGTLNGIYGYRFIGDVTEICEYEEFYGTQRCTDLYYSFTKGSPEFYTLDPHTAANAQSYRIWREKAKEFVSSEKESPALRPLQYVEMKVGHECFVCTRQVADQISDQQAQVGKNFVLLHPNKQPNADPHAVCPDCWEGGFKNFAKCALCRRCIKRNCFIPAHNHEH